MSISTSVFQELAVRNAQSLDILRVPTRGEFRKWLMSCSPAREFFPYNAGDCPLAQFFQDDGREVTVSFTEIRARIGDNWYLSSRDISGTWMEKVQKAWNARLDEKRGQSDGMEFFYRLTRDEVLDTFDRQMGYA